MAGVEDADGNLDSIAEEASFKYENMCRFSFICITTRKEAAQMTGPW